jgi:hypothetical protein
LMASCFELLCFHDGTMIWLKDIKGSRLSREYGMPEPDGDCDYCSYYARLKEHLRPSHCILSASILTEHRGASNHHLTLT